MPPEGAAEHGFFDRSFSTKKEALAYQKKVKAKFPEAPCCLIDLGRWIEGAYVIPGSPAPPTPSEDAESEGA